MLNDYLHSAVAITVITVSHLGSNQLRSKHKNNVDELINIPTKAEERRSKFSLRPKMTRTSRQAHAGRSPRQNTQLIHDPQCFQSPRIRSLYTKNPCAFKGLIRQSENPFTPLLMRKGTKSEGSV